jgi:hypothetical protein
MRFRDWLCEVRQSQYANGRTALLLVDAKTGDSIAVATVNLPDEHIARGEVFIKDHSENQGMLAALEKAGIVRATGETVPAGFVQVPKAMLLIPEMSEFKKILDGKAETPAAEKIKDRGIER